MLIKDPVQLFQNVVARMNDDDFTAAAGLRDPASLAQFRRMIVGQFSPNDRPIQITPEEYMKSDPDMPREVAEYQVKQLQKRATSEGRLQQQFPNVASVAALQALEPTDLFAEFLYGRSPSRQMREQAKRGTISKAAADALFSKPLAHLQFDALGAIADGDRVAHVLYRHQLYTGQSPEMDRFLANTPADEREFVTDTTQRGHPQTFTCRKQPDGGWLAIADYSFIGGGMSVTFSEARREEEDDENEDVLELSP